MMRRGKNEVGLQLFFFLQGEIFVLFRGWWGYPISLLLLSLSARVSTRAALLSKQLHLKFYFTRGCQHRAQQDEGHGGAGLGAAGPACLRLRVQPLFAPTKTWGANVGVCQCWQQFSAGKDKFLLEVSLGPACLKNDCLFKICRIGANSALIPELLYLSEDYQKTKMKTKACGDWFSTSGKGQGRLQRNITFGFSQ